LAVRCAVCAEYVGLHRFVELRSTHKLKHVLPGGPQALDVGAADRGCRRGSSRPRWCATLRCGAR